MRHERVLGCLLLAAVASVGALGACGGGGGASADAGSRPDGAGVHVDAAPGPAAMVHFIGRFDTSDAAGPRFSFSGSRLVTRFAGTTLSVSLNEAGPNQYSVRLDGVEQPVLKTAAGTSSYVLAAGLAAGEHDLVLTRRTESFFGITQFLGFEGATLVTTPAPYARFIEFVGDSITCGYGVLGAGPTCSFSADTESEPDAYGGLAADALAAGHAAIAYSGKGVYKNYDADPTALMPEIFARTFGDAAGTPWGFSAYTPDVVVVNLGTNDFSQGDPGQGFADAYDAFVQQIRGHYASAWIVLALPPMLSDSYPAGEMHRSKARAYLQAVVASAHGRGDSLVDFVELDEQLEADGLGCDYHPGKVTQQKMATQLATKLRALTGW